MQVKIGDTWHRGDEEPVMVLLSEQDKENIRHMLPNATRYAVAPNGHFATTQAFATWMDAGLVQTFKRWMTVWR